jgi:hypothetical protein
VVLEAGPAGWLDHCEEDGEHSEETNETIRRLDTTTGLDTANATPGNERERARM